MSLYQNSIDRAILEAKSSIRRPYKCAKVGHVEECGLIHVLSFLIDESGCEVAQYYLPGTNQHGERWMADIPDYQYVEDQQRKRELWRLKKEEERAARYAQKKWDERSERRQNKIVQKDAQFLAEEPSIVEDDDDKDLFIPCQA